MITERVPKHRDNIISIGFDEDGALQAINAATRITIKVGDAIIDSSTAASGVFDWTTNGASGQLDLKLGRTPEIIALRLGPYLATVTYYDATYANGLEWSKLMLEVC